MANAVTAIYTGMFVNGIVAIEPPKCACVTGLTTLYAAQVP